MNVSNSKKKIMKLIKRLESWGKRINPSLWAGSVFLGMKKMITSCIHPPSSHATVPDFDANIFTLSRFITHTLFGNYNSPSISS